MKRLVQALFAAAALIFAAPAALAHVELVSSSPAANATVAAPGQITLRFSDTFVPAFSSFEIVNAAGAAVEARTSASEDRKSLVGIPARPLAAGRYTLNWRIASGDGHRMTGSFAFTVR